MKLWESEGKKVRFTLKNGHVYEGVPYQYTSELDNEPDGACIYIEDYEILESEVAKIEVIE